MGFAIAESLANKGAWVYLVTGPTSLTTQHNHIKTINIETALEMYEACQNLFPECKGAVLAAAVSDFRPKQLHDQKIKKGEQDKLYLELEKNPDILKYLGSIKKPDQVLMGFSLETENGEANALKKLRAKNLDAVVLNMINEKTGFGKPLNEVTLFDKHEYKKTYPIKTKEEVGKDLVNYLEQFPEPEGVK